MKKNIFLLSIILFSITACNNDEAEINTGTDNQKNQVTFTTRADATDGVSVLIFRKEQQKTNYYYQEEFKPTWVKKNNSEIGTSEKVVQLGSYQFLFYRWDDGGNTTMTVPETGKTKIENIRFNAKPDAKSNYVLPVDTVWLPIDSIKAKEKYEFTGINNKTVSEKLMRAVSLVEVKLRRGYKINPSDTFYVQPYESGKSILNHFDKITLDIKKVGTSVGVNGNYGTAGTYVSDIPGKELIDDPSIGEQGFAIFNGPLVFPNENEQEDSEIVITLTPKQDPQNPYGEKAITVKGKLQRNKKLEINLWLTTTYKHIEVFVDIKPIEKEEDGDVGIWE